LVFELEPMYATSDRQTDGQTDDGRRSPLNRGGGIISGPRGEGVKSSTLGVRWPKVKIRRG